MLRFRVPLVLTGALSAIALAGAAAAAGAGGVTGPAFYVDGELYRTVGTPTDFSNTGAPEHSYDTIYAFLDANEVGLQMSVATAAPGDDGYNGGRWQVQAIVTDGATLSAAVAAHDANGSGDLDSDEEVTAAIMAGDLPAPVDGPSFECPVIPLPGAGHGHGPNN